MNTKVHRATVKNIGLEVCGSEYNFCSISPDGLIELQETEGGPVRHGVLEIKTVQHGKPLLLPKPSEVSLLCKNQYYAQVQMEMYFFNTIYGWDESQTFCDFVFFGVDKVDRPLPLAQHSPNFTYSEFHAQLPPTLQGYSGEIYDVCIVATTNGEGRCYLEYTSDLGADYKAYPLIAVQSNGRLSIYAVLDVCVPQNFSTTSVGYEWVATEQTLDNDLDRVVRILGSRTSPETDKRFELSTSRNMPLKPYMQRLAAANRIPYKGTKESILRHVQRLPSPVYPDVTGKAWITCRRYKFNKEWCEKYLKDELHRLFDRHVQYSTAVKQTFPTPPCDPKLALLNHTTE